MRRIFIVFGIAVFLLYCWASVVYQNQVKVPEYRLVKVDVLGNGRTRAQWDADSQARFQRLMQLESAKYQLPEGARVPAPADPKRPVQPEATDAYGNIATSHPLSADDFERLASGVAPDKGLVMELRDTRAIYALVNRNYLLRDPVTRPGDDQTILYSYATPIDKEMIDSLIHNGITMVTVTGHAPPVNFEIGTSLIIAVIFLTLAAALKPLLWDPFQTMLDKRRRELDTGAEASRQNALDETRLEETRKTANAKLLRELDDLRNREQGEAGRLAGSIVREARDKEKQAKLAGLRRLGSAADSARETLREDIPALAEAIADALVPTGGDTRREK